MEQVTAALRDEAEETQQQHTHTLERLRAEHGRVEVALHEEVALLQDKLEAAVAATEGVKAELGAAREEAATLREAQEALKATAAESEAAMGGFTTG